MYKNYDFFVFLLVLLLLYSCDAEHIKDYTVINEYSDTVILNYKIGVGDFVQDTIYPNESLLIYSASYIYGTVGVSDDRMRLSIKDMSLIVKDKSILVDENDWEYVQHGKYYADYILKVNAALIERIK